MWTEKYTEEMEEASANLAEVLARDIEDVFEAGRRLDVEVREVALALGARATELLFGKAGRVAERDAKQEGLGVQRREEVRFKTLLGTLRVASPYLYDRDTKASARPMLEHFGVHGEHYSDALDRALSDFGAETSHAQAAERFEEHYGIEVGRTTVRSRTMEVARAAEAYVDERLAASAQAYDQPEAHRPIIEELFGELDGCMIRCGEFMSAAEARARCEDDAERARLADYEDDERVCLQHWREVRTGLVLPPGEVDPTYVSRRGSWPQLAERMFGAGCEKGLGFGTHVIIAGDGGNGIKAAVEEAFAHVTYVLDRPHLKGHIRQTGEVLGAWRGQELEPWLDDKMRRIDDGHVGQVLAEFEDLLQQLPPPDLGVPCEGTPAGRLEQLIGYLTRFYECVHYGEFAANDWPMASGRAESCQKSVVQARLKLAGARWKEENLTPMCALRALRASGWWGDFWQWENGRRAAA